MLIQSIVSEFHLSGTPLKETDDHPTAVALLPNRLHSSRGFGNCNNVVIEKAHKKSSGAYRILLMIPISRNDFKVGRCNSTNEQPHKIAGTRYTWVDIYRPDTHRYEQYGKAVNPQIPKYIAQVAILKSLYSLNFFASLKR